MPSLNLGNRQSERERADNVFDISIPSDLKEIVVEHSNKRFNQSTIYGDGNASRLGAEALNKWTPKLKGGKAL